jgi:enoyl-CoA hydratase/carnithine racemase
MSVIKRQVWRDWDVTLEESAKTATQEMLASFGRPDFAEGVASFLERRPPNFPAL